MLPSKIFFTKGVGIHQEKLRSFELALRAAGIAPFNLVNVSSIYPPGCKKISREDGLQLLRPGEIVHCVLARNDTNEPNRLVVASIGCAIPADPIQHGYISEHHTFGQKEEDAANYSEDLAASMLATTLGIDVDHSLTWDEREKIYKMEGKILRSLNVTQSAIGNKDGFWTTVVAAAVFVGNRVETDGTANPDQLKLPENNIGREGNGAPSSKSE